MLLPSDSVGPSSQRLLEDNYAFVYSIVRRLAGPDLDPDDLAQDVFVVAFDKLAGLRDDSCLRSWLYGISRRIVAQQRRRRRFRDALMRLWRPVESDEADTLSPERESAGRETERKLYEALDRLSEKKRETLILFALEGMDGAEIAELLGIPVATVWTRLHGARKDLLCELQKQGWNEQPALDSWP